MHVLELAPNKVGPVACPVTDDFRPRFPGQRWGRYAVTLLIEASALSEDEAGTYIAKEIAKWKRFDNASFSWDSATAVATFSAEVPVAISAAAAIGEARDAMENMLHSAVLEPGDYAIKALKVEWLSDGV